MKIIATLFCLLLSLTVVVQNKVADTSLKKLLLRDAVSNYPDFPLIMVTDKAYEGSMADLSIKIRYIEIFKGPGAAAIYGRRAARGVILISGKRNPPRYFYKPTADSAFNGPVVYIINGNLSGNNYANEKDIVKRDVLGANKLNHIYGRKLDSIVVITTRK